MTHARSTLLPDPAALAALAAQLRVWLLGLLAWLLDVSGVEKALPASIRRDIAREIADARREVLGLLIDLVVLHLRPQRRDPTKTPALRALHASRARVARWRALTRNVLPRAATLSGRVRVLIAALSNLETYVRRMIVRIARRARGAFIVRDGERAPLRSLQPAPALRDSS